MHPLGARLHPTELRFTHVTTRHLLSYLLSYNSLILRTCPSGTTMKRSPVPDKETQCGTEILGYLSERMNCIVMYAKVVVAHVAHFYQTMYLDVNTLVYTQPQCFIKGLFETPTNASMPMPTASASLSMPNYAKLCFGSIFIESEIRTRLFGKSGINSRFPMTNSVEKKI
jgi:hypothetical protein